MRVGQTFSLPFRRKVHPGQPNRGLSSRGPIPAFITLPHGVKSLGPGSGLRKANPQPHRSSNAAPQVVKAPLQVVNAGGAMTPVEGTATILSGELRSAVVMDIIVW